MATRILSAPEQVAACLREHIERGRWSGTMPGIHRLCSELGFPRKQVERALLLLEKNGVLCPQGVGRKRLISTSSRSPNRPLSVAILDYDSYGLQESFIINLTHRLSERGHTVKISEKTLVQLGMNAARVAKMVEKTAADAWIVRSAPRTVLQTFIQRNIPVFAVFGNFPNLPIAAAGLKYLPPMLRLIRQFIGLGHRRIVLLCGSGQLKPSPGVLWSTLLAEIENHGIPTSAYNLPRWENTRDGFHQMLDALFKHTPPTALIIEEPIHLIATLQFCAHHGIHVPQDLSLSCMQASSQFDYCHLPVSVIDWNYRPISRHIDVWIDKISQGKPDTRQHLIEAELIDGATIAPAP